MTETIRMQDGILDGDQPDEKAPTLLDDLRAELAKPVQHLDEELVVPARPDFKLKYRTNITHDELKLWQKRSKETRAKDSPLDMKRLCVIILANTNIGLIMHGAERFDGAGRPLTFANKELHDMLGVQLGGPMAAVERMYGYDGHIIVAAQALLAIAGFQEMDMEDGDPLVI